jgi:hypothetical protein
MGLYLCVFDGNGEELEGVELGAYADFNFFRDAVKFGVENGVAGAICPLLQGHSDCDGEWTVEESKALLKELDAIEKSLSEIAPVEFNSDWKREIAKTHVLSPRNLLECFFDIDGEPLVFRLRQLAEASINSNQSILFQ